MKIYLDVCCLNRPFDDQSQDRIRLESESIVLILGRIETGEWEWFSSEVVDDEIEKTHDPNRRERLKLLSTHADEVIFVTDDTVKRAIQLQGLGFGGMDALHLACAEGAEVDIFLTTDDRLIRRAGRIANQLQVMIDNPLSWLVGHKEMKDE